MGEMIKIRSKAEDGFEFGALHSGAQGRRRGGIVVIQEIFGIDQYVRANVERWAALGFEAVAPSMYDRTNPGFDVGHDDAGMAQAMAAVRQAKPADALADIQACINYLAPRGPVFIVGYCYGGALVWQAAGRLDEMLEHAADYLEREFDMFTATMLSLLEPAVIVVMGAMVALIILSILLPVLQLDTLAGLS